MCNCPSGCFKRVCSAPVDQGQSPAGKAAYPGGPGTKITSVSTGNLCADVSSDTPTCPSLLLVFIISAFTRQDEPSPPRPEAYPIPTQAYPREYFTIPASKSQDRVVGPGQGPSQHWQGLEDRERLPVVDNIHNSMQVVPESEDPRRRHREQPFSSVVLLSLAHQPLLRRHVPSARRPPARGAPAAALPAGLPAPGPGQPGSRSGLSERSAG